MTRGVRAPELSIAVMVVLIAAWPHHARAADETTMRIAQQRRDVDARYADAVTACKTQFFVNDCIDTAKREHRKALEQLRQERQAADDARRRERATERLRAIETRELAASANAASAAPPAASRGRASEPKLARPAASRSSSPQPAHPPRPAAVSSSSASSTKVGSAKDGEPRVRAAEQRRLAAEKHREDVLQRNAELERKRAPSAGLPVPAAASATRPVAASAARPVAASAAR